jgi:hypothetical protein
METVVTPRRIQLRRAKGWRMPPNTVKVDRTSTYGNPFTPTNSGTIGPIARFAAECAPLLDVEPLRGKNLACWCHLCDAHRNGRPLAVDCPDCAPCHADVLLELANREKTP